MVNIGTLLLGFVSGLILVWCATAIFRKFAPGLGLVAVENFRSSHIGTVPVAGGVTFVVISPLIALFIANQIDVHLERSDWALLVSGWFIAIVSLIDDWKPLPARVRLVAQVWAVLGLIIYARYLRFFGAGSFGVVDVGWLGVLITIVWVLGMSNAFNFMDGMDGLVAGQSLIVALSVAWMSMNVGLSWMAILSASLGGGLLGFFMHNVSPARVFMGDVGSIWLGFLFSGMAVIGAPRSGERLSLGFWVLILGIFLLDSGLTLGRRLLQGEPVLEAHRTHYYQRLLSIGWGHGRVTTWYLVMATILAGVSIVHFDIWRLPFVVLVVVGLMAFAGTFALVHYVESYKVEFESEHGSPLGKVTAGGLLKPFVRLLQHSGTVLMMDGAIVVIAYLMAFRLGVGNWFDIDIRDGIIAVFFVHLTLNLALGIYIEKLSLSRLSLILRILSSCLMSFIALLLGEILLGPVRSIPVIVLIIGTGMSAIGFVLVRSRRTLQQERFIKD